MPKRALIALATFGLVATACVSISTPAVDYGSGSRFVPFVVDSLDDMGRGSAVALTADGIPYVSYVGFAEKLAAGEISAPRPFGAPTVPGVMVATSTTDGLWQRGAVAMQTPPQGLDPTGVAVPFGPVKIDNLRLTTDNTNGTSITVDASGTVQMAWTVGSGVDYATSKLGGTATVQGVFGFKETIDQAGPIGRPGIAIDEDGTPWIAFTIETSNGLQVHVVHQEGSDWVDSVVASFPSCNGCPAPQPTGIGVVGGAVTVVYADPGAKEVRAATLGDRGWTEAPVATGVTGFGLSFSSGGEAASAAYYTGAGTVEVAIWAQGAWSTTQVADVEDPDESATGNEAANTAVGAGGDGTLYVSWEASDGIQLASGIDSFTSIDIGNTLRTGADPALATSTDGPVALGWYDTSGQNLMVGYLGDLGDVIIARPSPSLTVSQAAGGGEECGSDRKVALTISATGSAFSTTCLVAGPGEPFTIAFTNDDPIDHNVAIYPDAESITPDAALFVGPPAVAEAIDYDVDPIDDPGDYYFRCDYHPTTMIGTLAVVKGAK